MKRQELLAELAKIISSQSKPHPLRVGITGVDASGKTCFADELATFVQGRGVIRASIDGFHNPRSIRYSKGRGSSEGYYRDSFNNQEFVDVLLKPLGPSGNREYKTAIFDHSSDSFIDTSKQLAKANDILIVDGIFLFRPELQRHWDVKIFLDVPFSTSIQRAIERDGKGQESDEMKMQNERYVPGQELYFAEAHPKEQAHIVIDNSDFSNPSFTLLKLL